MATGPASARAKRDSFTFLAGDSRKLLQKFPDESIDCVITSPPYAELKDYGAKGQLGFGQVSIDDYLADLGNVLRQLYRVSRKGAALWVVLDTVKTSGKTLVLPWEVITRAQQAEWKFEDLVIWDKGHSLPWSHVGHFRGVFEYVLLFSKERLSNFELDSIREIDHLSPYWVKYPERYNPHGKAPSDLWHFPIPVQGSWSKNGIRHYCPFPVGMVARMIALTTQPGQVVLDPFAGTGTVLAIADYLGRQAIGIDLNTNFVRKFDSGGFDALIKVVKAELGTKKRNGARADLTPLIIKLRTLKSPRTLFSQLSRPDRLGNDAREAIAVFVLTSHGRPANSSSRTASLGRASLHLLMRRGTDIEHVRQHVAKVLAVPPLSKFGLEFNVKVVSERLWKDSTFFRPILGKRWFVYTKGNFSTVCKAISRDRLSDEVRSLADRDKSRFPPIVSTLKVDIRPSLID